tara:strand:- start:75 stop:311 length:237 start_codon:yes stop_codon:yes gene_type:complete
MIRTYIIGVSILLIAIIANVIVKKLGFSTWYDFGPILITKGFIAIKEVGLLNLLWLFIIYPLVLSLGYLIGEKICSFF